MDDPIKDFHQQLQKTIAFHGTKYRAAQIIGAETDEPLTTVHGRLRKWDANNGLPESITKLINDLYYLDFVIKIEPK